MQSFLPHGVLFRGNVEAEIRKNIIGRGYIQGIIGLPHNLFYGTSIPASIIVLDKENAQSRKGIFMIDASEGFVKDGNKNRLQAKDIHKIVDTFTKQLEIPKFSRLIPFSEISSEKNDYNLNIPRYIDSQEKEDIQDIEGHLKGGIQSIDVNDLEKYWKVYPNIRKLLFSPLRDGYLKINVDKSKINSTIFEHKEFKKFSDSVKKAFELWKKDNLSILSEMKINSKPKETILIISEDLLVKFSKLDLIDKYDSYQKLMTYWEETMQDDAFLISMNGWNVSIFSIKDKKDKIIGWDGELIPKNISKNQGTMAEVIENNVRRLITEERPTNPKYYERMSVLLKELVAERKKKVIKYEQYLDKIAELCKKVTHQSNDKEYPDSIDSKGKRTLYDNLNTDDEIALAVDKAIITTKADSWRGTKIKEKAVYIAIKKSLKKFKITKDEKIDLIFEIIKEPKNGY